MMIQKFLPKSAHKSLMAYEIYRNRTSAESDFKLISDMYARVMTEDKVLCNNAQKNIERGIFINGQLHPKYEKAPLFFQDTVRQVLIEHHEQEKIEGRAIWPAKRNLPSGAEVSEKDETLCSEVCCRAQKAQTAQTAIAVEQETLAW